MIVCLVSAAAIVLATQGIAQAQTAACSSTSLRPGQVITVTGSGVGPGATITLRFNGFVIGGATADGFGNFSVSGAIPAGTTPGTYQIRVDFNLPAPGSIFPCTVVIQNAAVTPTPSPSATRSPRPARTARPAPAPQQQQQQQQQQLIVPAELLRPRVVHFVDDGNKLPKTGVDAGEVGGIGTASLAVGMSLMEFARRRRRNWSGSDGQPHRLPTTDWVPTPHVPAVDATPASAEADLMLPYVEEPASTEWPFPPLFDEDDIPKPSF